jgi:RNA polymerase sigma factor for flagellar operon FliA
VAFEGYCDVRVRGALLDELRAQDWLPRPWRTRVERRKRAVESLRGSLRREPDDFEIAAALGITLAEYVASFCSARPSTPGSTPPAWVENSGSGVLDVVADSRVDATFERLTREDLLALVTEHLTPQECRIVYLKYWEDLSLREIGELERLSESRVCKIHLRLLERLQARLSAVEAP